MLYTERIAVCPQIYTNHINTQCGQNLELLNVKLAVHIVTTGLGLNFFYKNQPVNALFREIIAVCSQIHTKHINTLCGQNEEFVIFKPGGTYSNHWALKG